MTDRGSGTAIEHGVTDAEELRQSALAATLRPVVSPETWLAVVHLLGGVVIGIVSFTVAVIGATCGIGLLPLFLLGVPVLIGVLWACDNLALAERARFWLLLGADIAPPARQESGSAGWPKLSRLLLTRSSWLHFGYALVRLPLSVVGASAVSFAWSTSVALLTLPAYNAALPGGAAHLGDVAVRNPLALAGLSVAGLALLLAAPWVTRGLAVVDTAVAQALLGSGRRADLTARIGELETSRAAVVDAAEVERRRIERDLHDGAQQRLVSLAMELGRARAKFGSDPVAAQAIVDQAHEQAKAALTELRNLVRGVHPPVLSDRGLDAALSGLAALSPVPVTVTVGAIEVPVRPPAQVEAIAYFVVAEALTNIAKHSRASQASVAVRRLGDLLVVTISDDGIGGADPAGQGLSGLAARVAGVDGRLSVTSPAGGPTVIEVALPCGS